MGGLCESQVQAADAAALKLATGLIAIGIVLDLRCHTILLHQPKEHLALLALVLLSLQERLDMLDGRVSWIGELIFAPLIKREEEILPTCTLCILRFVALACLFHAALMKARTKCRCHARKAVSRFLTFFLVVALLANLLHALCEVGLAGFMCRAADAVTYIVDMAALRESIRLLDGFHAFWAASIRSKAVARILRRCREFARRTDLRLLASARASLLHPPQGAEKRFKTSEILGVRE